jgi:hypothetical protein
VKDLFDRNASGTGEQDGNGIRVTLFAKRDDADTHDRRENITAAIGTGDVLDRCTDPLLFFGVWGE